MTEQKCSYHFWFWVATNPINIDVAFIIQFSFMTYWRCWMKIMSLNCFTVSRHDNLLNWCAILQHLHMLGVTHIEFSVSLAINLEISFIHLNNLWIFCHQYEIQILIPSSISSLAKSFIPTQKANHNPLLNSSSPLMCESFL